MAWQQNEWFGARGPEVAGPRLESKVGTPFMLSDLGDVSL